MVECVLYGKDNLPILIGDLLNFADRDLSERLCSGYSCCGTRAQHMFMQASFCNYSYASSSDNRKSYWTGRDIILTKST
jgi:hypothetical protein